MDENEEQRQRQRFESLKDSIGFSVSKQLIEDVNKAVLEQGFVEYGYHGDLSRRAVDIHACAHHCVGLIKMHPHSAEGAHLLGHMMQPGSPRVAHIDEPANVHALHSIAHRTMGMNIEHIPLDRVPEEIIAALKEAGATDEDLAQGIPVADMSVAYITSLVAWPMIVEVCAEMEILIYYGHSCDESA